MISTGYDLRCETFHFAWRKICFVFAGFGLVDGGNEMGRGVVARRHSECRRLGSCGRKKLRKRAAKPMKSLARVNLRAGSAVVVSCADARPNKWAPGTATETAASAGLTRDHHTRANPCALIKVDHVLVRHADAARRNRLSDRIRFIGAVDSIECAREIHGARAERIVRTPIHMTGKVGPTPQHLGRRRPIRPLSLVPDAGR